MGSVLYDTLHRGIAHPEEWQLRLYISPQYSNRESITTLDEYTHRLLERYRGTKQYLRENVLLQSTVTHLGVSFSTCKASLGNSHVIIGDYPHGSWYAGRIMQIFVLAHRGMTHPGRCFAVIDRFRELSSQDAAMDPYRKYPAFLAGRLFYQDTAPAIITFDHVICHFAATPVDCRGIRQRCLHVLPLIE